MGQYHARGGGRASIGERDFVTQRLAERVELRNQDILKAYIHPICVRGKVQRVRAWGAAELLSSFTGTRCGVSSLGCAVRGARVLNFSFSSVSP